MKKTLTTILAIIPIMACAQGYRYSEEFQTGMLDPYIDRDIEIVDATGRHFVGPMSRCFRQDAASGLNYGYMIASQMTNTYGLHDNVARAVEAARPRRTSSSSRITASNMAEARRTGKNYNYNTSQQHIDWLNQKREQQEEARRREQERKRQEAIARKIADDNRAAATEAATNALLQVETNRRIQRDYYNANEGAYYAQMRARQAHRVVGPQFKRQTTSNSEKAKLLRGQNKPRRIMYPQRKPQNTARKQLAQVQRKSLSPEQGSMLKKALMARAEQRRRAAAEKRYNEYKGIKLSDHAVSTLGRDWHSDDFKTGPLAPPPVTRVSKYVEPEWLTKQKVIRELLGDPPMTSDEEFRLLKEHELLGS